MFFPKLLRLRWFQSIEDVEIDDVYFWLDYSFKLANAQLQGKNLLAPKLYNVIIHFAWLVLLLWLAKKYRNILGRKKKPSDDKYTDGRNAWSSHKSVSARLQKKLLEEKNTV